MSKISVTANWDGLPPLNAEDVITRLPPYISVEASSSDPTVILVDETKIPLLEKAVKRYGLEIHKT